MGEAAGFVAVIVWLALGGWAFRKLAPHEEYSVLPALLVICVLLGPFLFGIAVADTGPQRIKEAKERKE